MDPGRLNTYKCHKCKKTVFHVLGPREGQTSIMEHVETYHIVSIPTRCLDHPIAQVPGNTCLAKIHECSGE